MIKTLDQIGASAVSPRSWRRRTRRVFLVALPFSLPLWGILLATLVVAFTLRAIFKPLVHFWTAPPKRRYSYYSYGDRHASAPDNVVPLVPRQTSRAERMPMSDCG